MAARTMLSGGDRGNSLLVAKTVNRRWLEPYLGADWTGWPEGGRGIHAHRDRYLDLAKSAPAGEPAIRGELCGCLPLHFRRRRRDHADHEQWRRALAERRFRDGQKPRWRQLPYANHLLERGRPRGHPAFWRWRRHLVGSAVRNCKRPRRHQLSGLRYVLRGGCLRHH